MNQSLDFYADIISDTGAGANVRTVAPLSSDHSTTAFFANKRAATKDKVITSDGSNMIFENVGVRNRGVRPWERARHDANLRRQKELEFHHLNKRRQFSSHTSTPLPTVQPKVHTLPLPLNVSTTPSPLKVIDTSVIDAWDD